MLNCPVNVLAALIASTPPPTFVKSPGPPMAEVFWISTPASTPMLASHVQRDGAADGVDTEDIFQCTGAGDARSNQNEGPRHREARRRSTVRSLDERLQLQRGAVGHHGRRGRAKSARALHVQRTADNGRLAGVVTGGADRWSNRARQPLAS